MTASLLRHTVVQWACVLAFLSTSGTALAQPSHGKPLGAYEEPAVAPGCDANALTMSKCEARRAEHSERHLNTVNAAITDQLPAERRTAFQKTHSIWLQFRNTSCEFDAAGAAGNSRAFRRAACVHAYNKSRIALLAEYSACLEGGCSNDVQLYYLVWPSKK